VVCCSFAGRFVVEGDGVLVLPPGVGETGISGEKVLMRLARALGSATAGPETDAMRRAYDLLQARPPASAQILQEAFVQPAVAALFCPTPAEAAR